MEAFGGTGDFSAGLPAPETRKGKLVSDRCHGEGAGKGRVMSSLHVDRVASRWTVACAVSCRRCTQSACCSNRRLTANKTHTVQLQVRCRRRAQGRVGWGSGLSAWT